MDLLPMRTVHAFPIPRRRGAPFLVFAALLLGSLALVSCQAEDGLEGSAGSAPGTPATWSDVDAAIASTTCRNCHPAIAQPSLAAPTDLVGVTEPGACGTSVLVVANSSSTSALYLALTGGRAGPCDMSTKGGAASVASTVLNWINSGAQ